MGNRWYIKDAVVGEDVVKGTQAAYVDWLLVLA